MHSKLSTVVTILSSSVTVLDIMGLTSARLMPVLVGKKKRSMFGSLMTITATAESRSQQASVIYINFWCTYKLSNPSFYESITYLYYL